MKKIACIGDKDSVLCFMAIGCSVFAAESPEEAAKILRNLASDESYPIIFLTENYYNAMPGVISDYAERPLPAIISLPGAKGSEGSGLANIKALVEKAIGADITFNY